MAIQRGGSSLRGKIGDEVHYEAEGKHIVRRAPRIDRERLATDPAYADMRRVNTEFGNASKASKLLRDTLSSFLFNARTKRLSSHVNQLMGRIKDFDPGSKGERTVGRALHQPSAIDLFRGFEFNPSSLVRTILVCDSVLDPQTGTLRLEHLDPAYAITFPKSATHVQLTSCVARFDFAAGTGDLSISPTTELSTEAERQDVVLRPDRIPTGDGIYLFLVKVVFVMRMENSQVFEVRNSGANGSMVVDCFAIQPDM